MDAFSSNGHLYDVAPEAIGALTEAPIVTDMMEHSDSGEVEHLGKLWWFPNYQVEDPLETLAKTGKVVFTYVGDELKEEPKDVKLEANNHLGEKEYKTFVAWKAACKSANPNVTFDGDKDICQAKGVGEWDGSCGVIYKKKVAEKKDKYLSDEEANKNRYNYLTYGTPHPECSKCKKNPCLCPTKKVEGAAPLDFGGMKSTANDAGIDFLHKLQDTNNIKAAEILSMLFDHDWEHIRSEQEISQAYINAPGQVRKEINDILEH